MNTTVKCVFCGKSSSSAYCQSCGVASRIEKFSHLLGRFEAASHSIRYHDDIVALVESSRQVGEKNYIQEYFSVHLDSQFGHATSFYTGASIRWCSSSVGSHRTIIFEEGQWLSEWRVASSSANRWQLSLSLYPASDERSYNWSGWTTRCVAFPTSFGESQVDLL